MIREDYDAAVIGGGLSGVIAALAAARNGIRTVLVQDRPMLGGNASSEFRMHICGADNHARRPDARESGIIEEILLENRRINPDFSYPLFDSLLISKVMSQENLDLHLNAYADSVFMRGGRIDHVHAIQMTTEKEFMIHARFFADATGDGSVAFRAGAELRTGREGADEYGESLAPAQADDVTMGSSVMFRARRMGHPVPFVKPSWAYSYTEDDLAMREHGDAESGYWWIEAGGKGQEIIADGEDIHSELMKILYGIWDHIKNTPGHDAGDLMLDWVSPIAGKRESRRVMGDYVLCQDDIACSRIFDDAVAYGGWPMDIHTPGGFSAQEDVPTLWNHVDDVYTIPYRCFYSRNIPNLFIAGRTISASHVAFSSSRVMGTCASGAEAVGNAMAIAVKEDLKEARDVGKHIRRLQQKLLRDDAFIPGFTNSDPDDIARSAEVSADSYIGDGVPENVVNGIARSWKGMVNAWVCDVCRKPSITFRFKPSAITSVMITADSDFSHEITPSIINEVLSRQKPGIPETLVKDFRIRLRKGGSIVYETVSCTDGQRHTEVPVPSIMADEAEVSILSSYGSRIVKIFEIRIY